MCVSLSQVAKSVESSGDRLFFFFFFLLLFTNLTVAETKLSHLTLIYIHTDQLNLAINIFRVATLTLAVVAMHQESRVKFM